MASDKFQIHSYFRFMLVSFQLIRSSFKIG